MHQAACVIKKVVHICQETRLSLVQKMVCRQNDIKTLSEPMMVHYGFDRSNKLHYNFNRNSNILIFSVSSAKWREILISKFSNSHQSAISIAFPVKLPLAARHNWWFVNITLGNDLVSSDDKPFPELILTQIYVAILRHSATMKFNLKRHPVYLIWYLIPYLCMWSNLLLTRSRR